MEPLQAPKPRQPRPLNNFNYATKYWYTTCVRCTPTYNDIETSRLCLKNVNKNNSRLAPRN